MSTKRPSFNGYKARIQVEGQDVEHYQCTVDEQQKSVTCWIASTAGKRFSMNVQKGFTGFHVGTDVTVDGHKVPGKALTPQFVSESRSEGITTGPQTMKPFVFGVLKVTDDDSLLANPGSAKAIGEIRIELKRMVPTGHGLASGSAAPRVHDVHEKAKKATPHRIEFGDEIRTTHQQTKTYCTWHERLALFVFRYTSLDMLKATGIATQDPPSQLEEPPANSMPSTSVKPSKRKVKDEPPSDDDVDEEDIENKKQEAELKAQLARLQKAREDKHAKKKVKRESRPTFLPGETIDLTL